MRDPNTWFPRLGSPTYGALQAADMDLTFHTPDRYRLASIGRLVESRTDGAVQTTHWVTERPTAEASPPPTATPGCRRDSPTSRGSGTCKRS